MANIYKTKKQEKSLDSRLDSDISLKNGNKLKKVAGAAGAGVGGAGTYVWTNRLRDTVKYLTFGNDGSVGHRTSTQVDIFPIPQASRGQYGTFEVTHLEGINKIAAYLGKWMNESEVNIAGQDISIVQGLSVALGATIAGGLVFLASGGASYLKNVAMNTIAKGLAKYQLRKTPKYPSKAQRQADYESILEKIPEEFEMPGGLEQELDA